MKQLYFMAVALFSILLVASCNTSGAKDEKTQETAEPAAPKTESSAEENKVAKTAPQKVEEIQSTSTSSDDEPFDYLENLTVFERDYMTTEVKYNASQTKVFNQSVSELPEDDPFYYGEGGPSVMNVKVLKTKISPSGLDYYLIFSPGPSADPSFVFYKEGVYDKAAFNIMGLKVYIPGNGNVYVEGHTNNAFNKRRKFTLSNGEFVEAEQPFYYVGLKTRTLKPVKLYKSRNLLEVIANLPADYSIEVLINDPENSSMFLVKTDFGLTGWIEIPGEYMFGGNELIEGIFYAGD